MTPRPDLSLSWKRSDRWHGTVLRGDKPVAYVQVVDASFDFESLLAAAREAKQLREALEAARHWHEQLDYDEALNVIDAALSAGEQSDA